MPVPSLHWMDALTFALMGSMRAVPHRAAAVSGAALGWLASYAGPRANRKSCANLLRAGVPDAARACRRGWASSGRTAFEMLWMFSRDPERVLVDLRVDGADALDGAVREGRGVLLVSAHVGNWELVPIAAGRSGVRVAVVARKLRAPRLERRVVAWRRRAGVSTLIRGAEGSSITAYRTLAEGGVLGCMMDRASFDPRIATPFLGGMTFVPAGPLTLAQRTGAAIVVGMAGRREGRAEVAFRRLPYLPSQSAPEIAASILRSIEDALADHPEDWLWIHRRQPPHPRSSDPTGPCLMR